MPFQKILVPVDGSSTSNKALDYALKLQPDAAEYLVEKGHLLQCQMKLADAAQTYRAAIALQPDHSSAIANAALCDELLSAAPGDDGKLSRESLAKLQLAMQKQQRPAAQLMPAATAQALAQAYVFLRRVEHRIQYLDDQQTHALPSDERDLLWLSCTLGCADVASFWAELARHRELVAQEFDRLLGQSESANGATASGGQPAGDGVAAACDLEGVLPYLGEGLRERVARWPEHPRVRALREDGRQRLLRLVQRTQSWVDEDRVEAEAAVRWSDWIEPLLRRESYLALLVERPAVHQQLLRLLGAARWPARWWRRRSSWTISSPSPAWPTPSN